MEVMMIEIAKYFKLNGEAIESRPLGSGLINTTYQVKTDIGRFYTLQRLNTNIFKDPVALMKNIFLVTTHLREKMPPHYPVLTLIPAYDGKLFHVDADGIYWRVFEFIEGLCLNQVDSPLDFQESGVAFGQFQAALRDFDATKLTETIPNFHHTPHRITELKKAINLDKAGRVKFVEREIHFFLEREDYANTLVKLQENGELPVRVTHNDTKLNNVVLDAVNRKALCVIDLDTVMPGLSVTDFGDSIRFGASTAAEDEKDLAKITLSLELFAAYTKGYLSHADLTKAEREHLCDGAKIITLEQGIRYLTDYINQDIYYKTLYEHHNLDRCRNQLKLIGEIENAFDEMRKIVHDC
jgi:Ser/Thr protein kinase RdoA (MazF antagonist)